MKRLKGGKTMTSEIYFNWRLWCVRLQQASDAFDRNRSGPHQLEYLKAWRFAEHKCALLERMM